MSLTEFNAEEVIRDIRAEGREEGIEIDREEGAEQKAIEAAQNLLKMNVLTPEQIAQAAGLPLERVRELQKELTVLV